MSPTTLRCTVDGPVATITLARPDKMNAFNATMHAELREALDNCEREEAVSVVVLTGEGRAFSSGQDLTVDLKRDEQGRLDLGPALTRDYNPLMLKLSNYPKPTIAALNGPAVGASMNIALACDIVVAARSAYLQEAFAKIGLIPDAGGTWILPRLIGPKLASRSCSARSRSLPRMPIAWGSSTRCSTMRLVCGRCGGFRRKARGRSGARLSPDQAGGGAEPVQRSGKATRPRGPSPGRGGLESTISWRASRPSARSVRPGSRVDKETTDAPHLLDPRPRHLEHRDRPLHVA